MDDRLHRLIEVRFGEDSGPPGRHQAPLNRCLSKTIAGHLVRPDALDATGTSLRLTRKRAAGDDDLRLAAPGLRSL
ncbi:hypothetical protein [Accumulibacter sp.]|uniref:hypothetical protein n=1 Tax=Accumulibacter sp. TaxID=2053492 RepID=UPI0025F1D186|nr:hypothetical protein [Accumulibacter sp.]MCM8593963.1 hypothetical protein [Accumulibacter sp.]MCM8625233.1 hypothetical protein [Accumulibacter sp.]MDS4048105.1 hypothetical protein [Accumulibacter sp.]